MNQITILNPQRLVFGEGAFDTFIDDFITLGKKRLYIVTIDAFTDQLNRNSDKLKSAGIDIYIDSRIVIEPDFNVFEDILKQARLFKADAVAGIGGGSVLDIAKLLAAFLNNDQDIYDTIGIGKLAERTVHLSCLPTTSGTGSEVSPNAILLDQNDNLKKGIVSPFLVPDATYVDPLLSCSVPAQVTAATGLDALTHCLEAYTNIFAHPIVDMYALEGIRLISRNLTKAIKNGNDRAARSKLSLGSLYGGFCLGPVNTAAVHALSYPLGGMFHIAHGLSNAILLPHVMEFNLIKAPERYADVALAFGAQEGNMPEETARNGVKEVKKLMKECGIVTHLAELNIPKESFSDLANGAIKVTRLLKNNIREVTYDDAIQIYQNAY
ncbi:MAG: iron-containing alcohol dehydrogenase [Balneolales bacterium]